MVQRCCSAVTAVGTSVDGMAYLACRNACGYWPDCMTQCIVDWPEGWVLEAMANVCLMERCSEASQCNVPAPECLVDFSKLPDCGECMEQSCCDEARACRRSADCQRIELCRALEACADSDEACLESCRGPYPGGIEVFDAYFECRTSLCPTECEGF
jgi:hypothetical protein